ncbi:MAG: hypothetical protein QOG50_3800 [Actinomycetota bacterium]|nr:hypothetical protein [Actinomycetota bacterium]
MDCVLGPVPVKFIAVVGSVVVVAGLVGAAFAFRSGSPSAPAAAATTSDNGKGFPQPPRGAVVYAREWGGDAIALGVVPQKGHVLAQVSVLGPQGIGVSRLQVSLNGQAATACGAGCYRTTLRGVPASVDVRVRSTRWQVALPAPWPPRDASAVLERAERVWRSLHSLTFHEHLASDAIHETTSTWRIEAPDRVAYQVQGGYAGIVVGDHRWDRSPTAKRWVPSAQSRLTQPVPAWVRVTDAHVLGTAIVGGRPAWRISFFDPGTPAWFTVAIDRQTFHTLDSRMTATAHFMHDAYSSFDTTPAILPPR